MLHQSKRLVHAVREVLRSVVNDLFGSGGVCIRRMARAAEPSRTVLEVLRDPTAIRGRAQLRETRIATTSPDNVTHTGGSRWRRRQFGRVLA